ncbi:MAG: universal stress protein [Patulibacter sp.]|nr:universal stress protein [Patulibacter sp.]
MYHRILVAHDGSDAAEGAFRLAKHVVARTGARLVVAHVVNELADDGGGSTDPRLQPVLDERTQRWEERLDGLPDPADGPEIERRVLAGPVADTLLDLAAEIDADLVVAGTHGVGSLRQVLFGSVSQRLLERAPCDVLFVRRALALDGSPPAVLVGFDGSDDARRALAAGENLADALGGSLVLAHVAAFEAPFSDSGFLGEDTRQQIRKQLHDHGHELLQQARSSVSLADERVVEERLEGHAREELLAACAKHAPAIAVVGTRGARGFAGLLVGSVTRDLLDYSAAPVLVVRGSSTGD